MIGCGLAEGDARDSVTKMRKLFPRERTYLKEMLDMLAEEVATFHSEISKREARIHELTSEMGNRYRYHHLIGKSKKMQQIYNLLQKINSSEATILIQGENGTGKELVAKAIHYNSPRKDSVFMAVNCSAFNDNLLDSELFGHVKGSFTGAIKDKKGFFEAANGGTLFLDEIGDTSLTMQVKLLRVLQEGTFLPVGATTPKKVNVRVIAATNKPLKEMIARGDFREDLYYRLNVFPLVTKALSERPGDILPIAVTLLAKHAGGFAKMPELTEEAIIKLEAHEWPGNVRELENVLQRALVMSGGDEILAEHLMIDMQDMMMMPPVEMQPRLALAV
jgi:transcriptional regulator with PAS, ATPase and Fis domain